MLYGVVKRDGTVFWLVSFVGDLAPRSYIGDDAMFADRCGRRIARSHAAGFNATINVSGPVVNETQNNWLKHKA
ncbi:hypothetical protein [Pandoraea sp. ISTKB]|uniref:hypothetical protein n=1 Tax=Pandoraea sp. ISTKB TaxID=1586708 RepID=UPI0008474F4E|nr:hypothetical protein [Pandoraea sp. ISTKB]ODP30927.1 hypothetical protein A9762_27500 [Pandoraea sp. ISTKB]